LVASKGVVMVDYRSRQGLLCRGGFGTLYFIRVLLTH